jgi:hypothetical protein
MRLAEGFGLDDYASPAGGCCFLTDENYSRRLNDLWQGRGERDYELDDIMLLKVGRHLRPSLSFKLLISRDQGEGQFLRGYRRNHAWLETVSHGGPLALVDGEPTAEDWELAARLVARYSQGRTAEAVEVAITDRDGSTWNTTVAPMEPGSIPEEWLL